MTAEFEYNLLIIHDDRQVRRHLIELFEGRSPGYLNDPDMDIQCREHTGTIHLRVPGRYGLQEEERRLFIHTASSAQEYQMLWRNRIHHVVLLNLVLPEDPLSDPHLEIGMKLLREIKHEHPTSEVIVFTDHMVANPAREALRNGAFYFIHQPQIFLDFVQTLVARIIQMTEGAHLDTLTGLYNRRFLLSSLRNFWEESIGSEEYGRREKNGDLSLILLDLNDFKAINDTYGHLEGDAALLHVAKVLGSCFRKTDIMGRIGGDEFAVIVPYTDHRKALEAAERTRREIQAHHLQLHRGPVLDDIALSIAAGVATCPVPNQTPMIETFLKLADEALYRAKKEWKGNVVCGYGNDGRIYSFDEFNA